MEAGSSPLHRSTRPPPYSQLLLLVDPSTPASDRQDADRLFLALGSRETSSPANLAPLAMRPKIAYESRFRLASGHESLYARWRHLSHVLSTKRTSYLWLHALCSTQAQ